MNIYQNIIITCSHHIIMGCNYSNDLVAENNISKAQCTKFTKLLCTNNESFSDTTNAIYVVNKYLKKIKEELPNNSKIHSRIIIDHKIYSAITKGTYKYWILNGKTETTNRQINEVELNTWKEFASLYSELFAHVVFMSLNLMLQSKPKYNVKNVLFGQTIINAMNKQIRQFNEKLEQEIFDKV